MAGLLREIGNFNGVASGQRATRDLPKGTAFNQVLLEVKENGSHMTVANMATKIQEVVVKFDGDIIWRATGNQLIKWSAAYGLPDQDGYLALHFGRPYMQTIVGQDVFSVGTANLSSFQIEVSLGTITGPELVAYGVLTEGRDRNGRVIGVGEHITLRQFNLDVASTGEIEVTTLPKGAGRALAAIHFFTDAIADVEFQVNHRTVLEGPLPLLNAIYKQYGYVKQSGMTSVLPQYDRRASSVQSMDAEDIRLRLNMTATGNIPYLVEMVEVRP